MHNVNWNTEIWILTAHTSLALSNQQKYLILRFIFRLRFRNLTLILTRIGEKKRHGAWEHIDSLPEAGLFVYDLRPARPSSYSYLLPAEAGVANW